MRTNASESQRYQQALEALSDRSSAFHSAPWLKSPFESHVWSAVFGELNVEIDFRVRLDDGLLLTDKKHQCLLQTFKCLLVLQTHPDLTGGVVYSSNSAQARVLHATHVCEYLLINAGELRLAEFGLGTISEADGYRMLKRLALHEAFDGIYRWTERVTSHLRVAASALEPSVMAVTLAKCPDLGRILQSGRLGLEPEELVRSRVWLWANGYYRYSHYDTGTLYTVDSSKLAELLYPERTLKATWKKPHFPELHVFRGPCFTRELSGAPVRGVQRSEGALRFYVKVLKSLPYLQRVGLPVPHPFAHAASNRAYIQQLDLQPPGRYSTLPHEMVLSSLRNALEFSLEYGEELLNTFCEAAERAAAEGTTASAYLASRSLEGIVGPKLRVLGTNCWSVALESRHEFGRGRKGPTLAECETRFFQRFRQGCGLYELLDVLGGALLIILGSLMARRQGELIDLNAGDFLDNSGTHLVFGARKRGAEDIRQRLTRPIPPIAAELLLLLQKFQDRLIILGEIRERTNLFCFPRLRQRGLRRANDDECNGMLDRFCDFFEVPSNRKGQRYYIRQHQLRRFFAILFFWGNSFSGLDTLRWFLGQTDSQHLYHYITETIPGEILRGVKVGYAVERTQDGAPETLPLLALIEKKLGTRNVMVLDADELGQYIDELMLAGNVSIEPEFFEGLDGKEYRIMICVTPHQAQ